ncbi:PD-(D/E)XK nuclease family protein, partial [Methylacidimicrobium cyclopophantes]|uniref:PD-(D/E)XK nuclease family protein n=1 Tax=Methylacidimicrobium cyclopophantes TaxID=1041766 RepID=UPI00319D89B2
ASASSTIVGEAAKSVLSCVESKSCSMAFSPPSGTILWREKPFEALFAGRWISGVFDRVHLFPGQSGRPVAAILYDFKTDREAPERGEETLLARYREQMEIYRLALGGILSLPSEEIRAFLVWVEPPRLIEVPASANPILPESPGTSTIPGLPDDAKGF